MQDYNILASLVPFLLQCPSSLLLCISMVLYKEGEEGEEEDSCGEEASQAINYPSLYERENYINCTSASVVAPYRHVVFQA